MARTHSAPGGPTMTSRFGTDYDNGGTLLGKGGEPIPTSPMRGVSTLYPHGVPHVPQAASMAEEDQPVAQPISVSAVPSLYEFYSDGTTWQRNMDGWAALHILNAIIGPLSIVLTEDQARKLPSDCRFHFRRRVKVEPEIGWDDPDPKPVSTTDRIDALEDIVATLMDQATRPVKMTDEELMNSDPGALDHGQKVRRGKLLAANRAEDEVK